MGNRYGDGMRDRVIGGRHGDGAAMVMGNRQGVGQPWCRDDAGTESNRVIDR